MLATKRETRSVSNSVFKDYIQIAKPGMIFSNLLGTIAGFCIAVRKMSFDLEILNLFVIVCIGTIFVIAASAVLNNIYDRDIDKYMERTKERALTNGRVSRIGAIIYAIILIAIGEATLYSFVNEQAALIGAIGFVAYAFIYTASKRKTVLNTEIGCISGATPPIIGYVAVTGEYDLIVLMLFIWMFLWQPPHFFALAIRRAEEYKAVGVPMLPVVKGNKRAKIHMLVYSILMLLTSTLLFFFNILGIWYFIVAVGLGIIFVVKVIEGFAHIEKKKELQWAKKTFGYSIIYLTCMFFVMMCAPLFN